MGEASSTSLQPIVGTRHARSIIVVLQHRQELSRRAGLGCYHRAQHGQHHGEDHGHHHLINSACPHSLSLTSNPMGSTGELSLYVVKLRVLTGSDNCRGVTRLTEDRVVDIVASQCLLQLLYVDPKGSSHGPLRSMRSLSRSHHGTKSTYVIHVLRLP